MKYDFLILGKKCQICKKKCSGEIIRADGDKYFHIGCFACKSILFLSYKKENLFLQSMWSFSCGYWLLRKPGWGICLLRTCAEIRHRNTKEGTKRIEENGLVQALFLPRFTRHFTAIKYRI